MGRGITASLSTYGLVTFEFSLPGVSNVYFVQYTHIDCYELTGTSTTLLCMFIDQMQIN